MGLPTAIDADLDEAHAHRPDPLRRKPIDQSAVRQQAGAYARIALLQIGDQGE
jgi:hypothetical protein